MTRRISSAIPADSTYTTNAVKHFRWKPQEGGGKRRIHQRPEMWQVRACWPWFEAEISRLSPAVIVTLGATAGQALFGSSFRITAQRGTRLDWHPPGRGSSGQQTLTGVSTIHPSAVLRADDRDASFAGLVSDLREAAQLLAGRSQIQAARPGQSQAARPGQSRPARRGGDSGWMSWC